MERRERERMKVWHQKKYSPLLMVRFSLSLKVLEIQILHENPTKRKYTGLSTISEDNHDLLAFFRSMSTYHD